MTDRHSRDEGPAPHLRLVLVLVALPVVACLLGLWHSESQCGTVELLNGTRVPGDSGDCDLGGVEGLMWAIVTLGAELVVAFVVTLVREQRRPG